MFVYIPGSSSDSPKYEGYIHEVSDFLFYFNVLSVCFDSFFFFVFSFSFSFFTGFLFVLVVLYFNTIIVNFLHSH